MEAHEDDWFGRIFDRMDGGIISRRKSFYVKSPVTPVSRWQKTISKVRRVQAHHRGVKKSSIRSHMNYIVRRDSKEHEDRLVCEIGDTKELLKTFDDVQPHYRVIIAPQRGDVLDMEKLAYNTCQEVMKRFGKFEYTGAVHEKLQSNGRLNKHIHLIIKAPFDNGAVALKGEFRTASARDATLQFEEKGLRYIPDPLDNMTKLEQKQIEREMLVNKL